MKSAVNTKTGQFLSQAAYDAWLEGAEQWDGELWTENIDQAASFVQDDAPPQQFADGITLEIVEAQ